MSKKQQPEEPVKPIESIGVTDTGYCAYKDADGWIWASTPDCELVPYERQVLTEAEFNGRQQRMLAAQLKAQAERLEKGQQ